MKIYSFSPKDESCILNTKNKHDSKMIIDGLSKGNYEELKPESIVLESVPQINIDNQLYDFPWLYPEGLLCSENTFKLLNPFLKGCGKWNSMLYENERVFYFSVTKELDALDEKLTDFIEHDGFKLGAKKYVFRDIEYEGCPIFRMKSLKGHYPVVTEEFVELVNMNKLSGLKFKELN